MTIKSVFTNEGNEDNGAAEVNDLQKQKTGTSADKELIEAEVATTESEIKEQGEMCSEKNND